MAVTGIVLHRLRVRPHDRQPQGVPRARPTINHYGEWLRDARSCPRSRAPSSLWLLRIGLIVAFALHIHAAYALTRMNHRARPDEYASQRDYVAANFASRTMRWTGDHRRPVRRLPPRRPHVGRRPTPTSSAATRTTTWSPASSACRVAIIYIVANLALGVHLFHGAWSLFQSLGLEQPAVQQVAPHVRHGVRRGRS